MIGGVSGSDSMSTLLQLLKQLNGSGETAGAAQGQDPFRTQIQSVLGQMGLDSATVSDVMSQIDAAVTEALQSADGADPHEAVKAAIDSVLEENGIDSAEFESLMEQARPSRPSDSGHNPFQAQFLAAAEELGLTASEAGDLKSRIDTAVLNALRNADSSSDPRSVIESAVAKVLEDNGIDVEQFKTEMQTMAQETGMPAPGQGPPPGGAYGPQGQAVGASGESTSTSSYMEAINELLEQMSSSSDAAGESGTFSLADIWQMLQNLPGGSLINTSV